MNNVVWALAVTLLAAGVLGRPQEDAGDDAVEEVDSEKGSGATDVVAVAEDGGAMKEEGEGEGIKEENMEKCKKCLAPIFRSKHDNFCIKCVNTGVIDTSEQEQIATALKCKKCKTKSKFRARHSEFCEHHCVEVTPSTTTTTEEAMVVEEEPMEDEEEMMEEEKPKKKKSNKKKKDKKKNKKKFATTFDDDEMETEDVVEDEQEEEEISDIEKFGFFGTLLKNIIVQNTWVDTPVA